MIQILHFIIFLTLASICTKPHFILANIRGNESDYQALLAIKAEISSDPKFILSSWNNSLHFCQWNGVTCGRRHKRVVNLELISGNLVGTLSPFVGNLSFLHVLTLNDNSFRGNIPRQISHLPRLQTLSMAYNFFEGEIPTNLSRCIHLEYLYLARNKLVGRIPSELATLPTLKIFDLSLNTLSGRLQDIGIVNMSKSLQYISLFENHLQGSIPDDIGRLKNLLAIELDYNMLVGIIPESLFNLSNLEFLSLENVGTHGHLPQDFGLRFHNIRYLILSNNFLTEKVPNSLSNLSNIEAIHISGNSFTGSFSLDGNNLPYLSNFDMKNAFSGIETRDLSFLDTLTNCTNFESLMIGGNSFIGTFPRSILNFSTNLMYLDLHNNQISGPIPFGLGKFVNLLYFELGYNHFTGSIPHDIERLTNMEHLSISHSNISGEIPSSLGNLTSLIHLGMEHNNLEGSLPKSIRTCQSLQSIYLSHNKLSGFLPIEVFQLSRLLHLEINQNDFHGSLPFEIKELKNLNYIDVSNNNFSGEIPGTLSSCVNLTFLYMSENSFVGSIPQSLSSLKNIQYLDLSCNSLTGQIPNYFLTWPYLVTLNLSFNSLEGEVTQNAIFANIPYVSLVGNNKLCGGEMKLNLPRCPLRVQSKKRRLSLKMDVLISVICVLVMVLSLTLCLYSLWSSRRRKKVSSGLIKIKPILQVSYHMLSRATNEFSPSNLIGVGGFGSVYRGILQQGDAWIMVAVKVMNLQNKGSSKSFNAECKALRNIRHKNLVKIITTCSSIDTHLNDFKALVYEFMPRGNLESLLHSKFVTNEHNQFYNLTLFQRLTIAIDVACAIEYLHTQCGSPIIHRDLKPTNILLDDDMTAHVGDFGISKFLSGSSTSNTGIQSSTSQVRGTIGYVAPEYGLGSKASTEGDVYSFGIIVLEMMTSKKPTDPMFTDGINLHDFAKSALSNRVMEIIDQRMFGDENVMPAKNGADVKKIECSELLVAIGVKCSVELPSERMRIKDVVNELKSARQNLIYIRY